MKPGFSPADEEFRAQCTDWLQEQMSGEFADIKGIHNLVSQVDRRREWEQKLAAHGWSCIGWPKHWGGRDATVMQQVIFAEEYARAGAPNRINHIGVELAGPTILAFGTEDQKARFLPGIAAGTDIWCQGYSEPNAGSDLANVKTRARVEDGRWIVNGQKIWTSLAHFSDFIFVIARSEKGSQGPKGLSFLLMDMNQPGVEVRPIRQMTGESEFSETFLTDATCPQDWVLGNVGDGWRVATALLGFERGVSTLAQQMAFRSELDGVIAAAKSNGKAKDPVVRQRIARAEIGLRLMRVGALRMLSNMEQQGVDGAALTYKIQWASWRRELGEIAMDVLGQAGEIAEAGLYEWAMLPNLYLGSRADTIYGGTNQIQRNLIAERGLGLPREPRGDR